MFVVKGLTTSEGLKTRKGVDLSTIALSEKYRPQRLSQILGQSYAVQALQDFADMPYPQAFFLHGPTGTGKSTAGWALARELGVNMQWDFIHVESARMNDDMVETATKIIRRVGHKDGWKLVLVDECHTMTTKAKGLFLSVLEPLPEKSVIVFTTHEPGKMEQAFIDRCESIKFESAYRTLKHEAQSYLARIWHGEGMPGAVPDIDETNVQIEGVLSFRRIARFVEQQKHKVGSGKPARVATAGINLKEHQAHKQTVRL